jgi:hypothetical protein
LRVALTVHILTPTSNLHRILIRVLGFLQDLWEVLETQGEGPTANFDHRQMTIESLIVILKTDRYYPGRWGFLHGSPSKSCLSFLFTLCSIVFL